MVVGSVRGKTVKENKQSVESSKHITVSGKRELI